MDDDATLNEATPLLASEAGDDDAPKAIQKRTPIPKLQLSIMLFSSLTEPLSATVIQPFINQMIGEFDIVGGDKAKVGYFVGILYASFFVVEATMILHWSRLSDRIGRKPVLLTGLVGIGISITTFGLSTSFWMLVVSRSVQGFMNGNAGVMKSMMAEMSDPTNIAQIFALVGPSWAIGATIAPLIGGSLQHPYERLPGFQYPFWEKFPYFLPCAAIGLFCAIAFVTVLLFLNETAPIKTSFAADIRRRLFLPSSTAHDDSAAELQSVSTTEPASLPLSAILNPRVILAGGNYCLLAMFDVAASTLLALFLASPVDAGGVGLDPHTIGLLLGSYGVVAGVFQGFAFAPLAKRVGIRNVFAGGMIVHLPIFALFPAVHVAMRVGGGRTPLVWALIVLLLAFCAAKAMAFGAIFIYIARAAPDKRSLGATNGVAHVAGSLMRAAGPAISTSLFAFSVENNIMGGYFVYVVLLVLTCAALRVVFMLPKQVWQHQ